MAELSAWFNENEPILKGKTEALLFGIAHKIWKCTEPLLILHEDGRVNATCVQKYLGFHLDSLFTLSNDFDEK